MATLEDLRIEKVDFFPGINTGERISLDIYLNPLQVDNLGRFKRTLTADFLLELRRREKQEVDSESKKLSFDPNQNKYEVVSDDLSFSFEVTELRGQDICGLKILDLCSLDKRSARNLLAYYRGHLSRYVQK
ncbi:MAG: hypothetical protein NT076_05770 [Candidatus Pacearchaeota archaeon]|nr:hypothetical protein [Candidatus Pacearchaeota archaeon]